MPLSIERACSQEARISGQDTIVILLEDGRVIEVTTIKVKGTRVRYMVTAPEKVRVLRKELLSRPGPTKVVTCGTLA